MVYIVINYGVLGRRKIASCITIMKIEIIGSKEVIINSDNDVLSPEAVLMPSPNSNPASMMNNMKSASKDRSVVPAFCDALRWVVLNLSRVVSLCVINPR